MRFTTPVGAVAALLVALVASSPARAERPTDALGQYRAGALSLDYDFFTGVRVTRNGLEASPGFFGGDAQQVFDGSPAALDDMDTYRTLRITGTTLWATGLALLVSELVLLAVDQSSMIDPDAGATPLFYGLLGGGAALGLVGGGLMQGANSYLSDAVHHYNADLEERLRRQAGTGPQLRFAITQRF